MRRLFVSLTLTAMLLLPALALPGSATQAAAPGDVVVAVLDTGIDAAHPEFAPGQVVAWRDFVNGQPLPYDDHGHGTATASLVAGANAGACGNTPKVSFSPGRSLIVGKVLDSAGSGNLLVLEDAIDWAVQQGADVISISIGGGLPVTGGPLPISTGEAISNARAAGVLVIVAAGNGFVNAGLAPYPSWSSPLGNNADALVVGGGARGGGTLLSTTGNTDPDITSWSDSVCFATPGGGYATGGGTSLSTPIVAGIAAHAMQIARDAGKRNDADQIESILIYASSNNAFSPYAREGMGFVFTNQLPLIEQWAAAGTQQHVMIQAYDAQGPHAQPDRIYRDLVTILQNAQLA